VPLPPASDVSARVQSLIAFHEKGDKQATARHLGIEVRQLTGLLSGDWREFSLDALGALVLTYGVSIDWLLALHLEPRPQPRSTTGARSAHPEGRQWRQR
jgi:hypothetical protein